MTFIPADYQPALPVERFIDRVREDAEAVEVDVLFVGGGPAGLAGAVHLARLARGAAERGEGPGALEIAVLEKAERLGDHCLSGAVLDAAPLRELAPDAGDADLPLRGRVERDRFMFLTRRGRIALPVPPTMRNRGYHVTSICEVVRWLGARAEELGVSVLTGQPADRLLMENGQVRGVRTSPRGNADDADHQAATEVRAKVTVLAEGSRGPLTQAYLQSRGIGSDNPQIFALGVKELWRVRTPLDEVVHTMGWPLAPDTFGGGWLYPMGADTVSLGLVVGLDSPRADLDPHDLLQRFKHHPFVRRLLEGGELLEWGAKTIPEGGYYSTPRRLGGDGVMIAGDSAGLVNVATLKGMHHAMRSGMLAARAALDALVAGDCSWRTLEAYDRAVRAEIIEKDLRRTRNMRSGFKHGLAAGALLALLGTVTGGRLPWGRIALRADADARKRVATDGDAPAPGPLGVSKVDANFKSGNVTRDDVPVHLIPGSEIPAEVGKMYAHLCPAGVYEWRDDGLVVNAPNCIDCRATDVLGPRWTVREGGSGPRHQQM